MPGQSNQGSLCALVFLPRGADSMGHYAVTFAFQFSNTEQEKRMKRLSLKNRTKFLVFKKCLPN